MRIKKIDSFSLTRNGETARLDFMIDGNKISADLLKDGNISVDGSDDEDLVDGIWNGATLFFDPSITGRTVYEVESNLVEEWLKEGNIEMASKYIGSLAKYNLNDASLVYGKDFFLVW